MIQRYSLTPEYDFRLNMTGLMEEIKNKNGDWVKFSDLPQVMNEEKAREILGERVKANNDIYDLSNYTDYKAGATNADLDGSFSVDEIEALAWWMRNMKAEIK